MAYFIIIRGPLGIGKSTVSQRLAKKLKAKYVSIDIILEKTKLDKVGPEEECIPSKNFIKAQESIISESKGLLGKGKIVIFDACFYHKEQIDHLIKNLPFRNYVFTLKAPLKICIDRDEKRGKTLGKDATEAVHNLVSRFDYGIVIETENKTEEQTLKEILSHINSTG